MNKSVLVYNSSDVKSKISADIYTPDESIKVKGVLQISHGMCEYVGRYEQMAEFFCSNGWVVCGNDHLGHKNTALLNRSKLGYFGEKGSWKYLVEDLELLRREMAGRYPELPYYLLGHSMGSFIARLYVIRFGDKLDGVIFSGTAGKNPAVGAGKALAAIDVALRGDNHVSKLINNMAIGGYGKAIAGAQTPVDWLCHDPEVCRKYLNDPYCTFVFTASAYRELLDMIDRCNRKTWYEQYPKELRTYIAAGDKDPVGANGKGPTEVYNGLKAAGVRDVSLKLWADARHEMHNEFEKQQVYEDYLAWLQK